MPMTSGAAASASTTRVTLWTRLSSGGTICRSDGIAGQTARTNIENIINSNLNSLILSTQRDKATGAYRFTPTPDWDFGVDYSHEHRTGLRPTAVSWGYAAAAAGDPPSSPRPT